MFGGDKAVLNITDAAAARIKTLMDQRETPAKGIKIGIRSRGCSGLSYTLEYCDTPEKYDETVEEKGVVVFVDAKAVMFLVGTEMDYVEEKLESGFRFNNPNEKARCGCGESFTV